jgi:hypothetical protein
MNGPLEQLNLRIRRIPPPSDRKAQELLTSAKHFASAIASAALSTWNPDASRRSLAAQRQLIPMLAAGIPKNSEAARMFREHDILRVLQVMYAIASGVLDGRPEPAEDEIDRLLLAAPDLNPPSKSWWQFWK